MLDHCSILTLFCMLEGFSCSFAKVFLKLISSSKSFIRDSIMAIGLGSCSSSFLQFTWMCFSLSKICLSVLATWGTQPSKCVLEKTVVEATVDTHHFLYFCIEGGGFHLEDIQQCMRGMDIPEHFLSLACWKSSEGGKKLTQSANFISALQKVLCLTILPLLESLNEVWELWLVTLNI